MDFKDIIVLAKAGYTYNQVKELLSATTEAPTVTVEETPVETPIVEVIEETPTETTEEAPTENTNNELEEIKRQLEETKTALRNAQHTAKSEDLEGKVPKSEDILADIARSFM